MHSTCQKSAGMGCKGGGCSLWGKQRKCFAGVHPMEGLNQGKSLTGKKIRQMWKQYGKNVPINI